MSDPTWAEAWDILGKRVNLWRKLELRAYSDSPNLLGLQDTLEQALEGEFIGDVLASVKADREAVSQVLSPGNIRAGLTPHLREIARAADIPEIDPVLIMPRLRDYQHANGYFVNSRDVNFGSVSAVTGSGTGAVTRLTVDENGYELEGVFLEAKRIECVADQGQVDKHQEVFEFRGTAAEQDFLKITGSGATVPLVALHAGESSTGQFIQNASFETFAGTAPTAGVPTTVAVSTDVTGWVITTVANAAIELDTTYRGYPGQPTNLYSLRFTNNNKIVQTPENTVRPIFDPGQPLYAQVAVYRDSNATGNITLRLGASETTVTGASLNNGAWNVVKLTVGTKNWYKNFRENGLTVELELDSYGGSGHFKFDDVIIGNFTNLDGTYYVAVGGATPFKEDDYVTVTDALTSAEGIISYYFWRAGLGHLVTTVPATQVTAAGGRTLTFADANPDTVTASSGSFVSDGYKVGMTLTVAGTSSNNGTYTITVVAATVITVSGAFAAEGPLSATATLNATAPISDPA